MTIEQVLNKFREARPLADTKLIERAYYFAQKAHQNQQRANGDPWIEHLLQAAYTLAELKLDAVTLAAGLLHDILEDTPVTRTEIQNEFSQEVAFLVEGVTNLTKIKYRRESERTRDQAENLRRIFLAMAKDIRVILIKLSDRLHNMKTLGALPQEKQKRQSFETLEIYAPLARRLGIRELSGELEDLSFAYAYPQEYQNLTKQVKKLYESGEKYLSKITPLIKEMLAKKKIRVISISSRTKRYYSLYQKLLRYNMNWHKIYDLVALRIIVTDIESCYAVLGALHKKWKPLIGRIKDYIAMPKPNGYRSLHTTVFCEDGKIIEFQIRTPQMHDEAERGIAAHWHYQEEKGLRAFIKEKILRRQPQKLTPALEDFALVRQLQNWQKETFATPQEFIESLKIDFLKNRIFIFTPKGDIIDLPEGATPVDFAYQIHTDLGHRCIGAEIDGKPIPLNQPLENGQMVTIIIGENKKPDKNWLEFVKTQYAKSRIDAWLKENK